MKRYWRSLLALGLALACILTMPFLSKTAKAVDLDADCSLTVKPGGPELLDDLKEADVLVDLYKVADADRVAGYDTYSYEALDAYADLGISGEMKDKNNNDWKQLAQRAAKRALNENKVTPDVSGAPTGEGNPITGLKPGLYLVIARGAALGNELEKYEDALLEYGSDSGENAGAAVRQFVTKAESTHYTYKFLPELVSVPTKESVDGEIRTDNPGDWIYDAQITLKPERSYRNGSLRIVKGLDGYVTGEPATFVFDIEGRIGDEVVYSDVVSMNFEEGGTKELRVEGIPVGAKVTVTEVYSGAAYELTSASTQTAEIVLDDIVSVNFTNRPSDEQKHGGSITNSFTNGEEGWDWQPTPDVPVNP